MRTTDEEHRQLAARAEEADLSISRYLVECGLTRQAPTFEDRRQRERALLEIRRVGNNLNQMARHLNARGNILNCERLEQLLQTVGEVLERMGTLWLGGSAK